MFYLSDRDICDRYGFHTMVLISKLFFSYRSDPSDRNDYMATRL